MNHILCCINDEYTQHCAVLLASLFENNKDLDFYIHIFSFALNDKSKEKLKMVVESYGQVLNVDVINMPSFELPNLGGHYISAETYIRLFVPQYLDESIDKIRLRCGSPWIAQQTCKPKDYHRTVHVFQ